MTTYYEVTRCGTTIKPIEAIKETDSCIWVASAYKGARKRSKQTSYEQLFTTREEAVANILARLKGEIDSCATRLEATKGALERFAEREGITL